MTIAASYLAICVVAIGGVLLLGTPETAALIYLAALAVAMVGVPHGGLDHWTGRRLLIPFFFQRWWLMFFPAYLTIAIAFAAGWLIAPVFTVVLFSVVSAWHFGREDDKLQLSKDACAALATRSSHATQQRSWLFMLTLKTHLSAIAVGGLIIFIPALIRGREMHTLLLAIVPTTNLDDAQQIVTVTQELAMLLVPVASLIVVGRIAGNAIDVNNWVPLATIVLAATTPILISFTLFFCGWHSLHGLQRLQREEGLSNAQFLKSVMPLSVLAIAGIALTGWVFQDVAAAVATGELANRHAYLQVLFIGLSAIAVPHLLLHEAADYVSLNSTKQSPAEPRLSGAPAS